MSNFTAADAKAMQDRVNAKKKDPIGSMLETLESAAKNLDAQFAKLPPCSDEERMCEPKRSKSHSKTRAPKPATTVGARPELDTVTARAHPQRKKSKYGNKRVQIDGIWFDSILEGRRYGQLKLLKQADEIKDFKMQVTYRLDVNGVHICDYRADFVVTHPDGHTEVEDTKGVETPKFILQKKLMLAVHGIKIVLIRRK